MKNRLYEITQEFGWMVNALRDCNVIDGEEEARLMGKLKIARQELSWLGRVLEWTRKVHEWFGLERKISPGSMARFELSEIMEKEPNE